MWSMIVLLVDTMLFSDADNELMDKRFDKLCENLEDYIRDLFVFGFNSKSYD